MEAERYVVRELEGYDLPSVGGSRSRPTLWVGVLDTKWNYRVVRAFQTNTTERNALGCFLPVAVKRAKVRAEAADLAARLNEATP